MQELVAFLKGFHSIDHAVIEEYASRWNEFSIGKKQVMCAEGEVEKYLYYVKEGVQKSYFLHKNKEHIIAFAYPNSFSGMIDSFITQTPSRYYLETITESKFLRISFEQHERMISQERQLETLFRKMSERFLYGLVHRLHEVMALTVEERFRAFSSRSAHLLQIIPQKDIASYLNIDATNFSKLINRIKI